MATQRNARPAARNKKPVRKGPPAKKVAGRRGPAAKKVASKRQAPPARAKKTVKKVKAAPVAAARLMLAVTAKVTGNIKVTSAAYEVDGNPIPRNLVIAVVDNTVIYRSSMDLGALASVKELKGHIVYENTDDQKIVVFDTSALTLTASGEAASSDEDPADDVEDEDEEEDGEEEDEEEEEEPAPRKKGKKKPADEEEDEDEEEDGDEDDEDFDFDN